MSTFIVEISEEALAESPLAALEEVIDRIQQRETIAKVTNRTTGEAIWVECLSRLTLTELAN